MKPIYPVLTLAAILISFSAPVPAFADDAAMQDNSVDSKFSADNAAHVTTSQIKPNHPKAGIGDGMMAVGHKHRHTNTPPKAEPIVPAPQPGPPPQGATSKDVVGKHDDGNK